MTVTRLRRAPLRAVAATWSQLKSGILGRGAVSFLFATAGVNISNFLFHIVISRLLGPAHYGAVGAILSILSLLAVPVAAAQLAVTQAVMGHVGDGSSFSLSKLTLRALLVGIVSMFLFAALTPAFDGFLHIKSPLPLILVSAWIPLATVGAVLQGALIGEYRFRAVAFAIFVGGGPVRLLFGAVMVEAGYGVTGAVIATVFAQAFLTGSLLFSSRKTVRAQHTGSVIRTTKRDMTLSIAALGSYTTLIGVDTFLARHFFAATVAGQYAAGAVAAHIALFVPGAIIAVTFPHLASGEGTSTSSRKAFIEALRITALLGIFTAIGLTVLSSFVIHLLFGSSYVGAIGIVGLLSFASAAIGVLSLFVYLHLARRSLVALMPWLGVALAIILISLRHESLTTVAETMLIVSFLTLLATGIPALTALAAAGAREEAEIFSLIELPPASLDLTLVVPFYNPGSGLGTYMDDIVDVLSKSNVSFEILAVSYGSTDQKEDQLAGITSDQFTLIRLDQEQGKGAALRAGFSKGRGEYLGFIDGAGALPANLLSNLLDIIRTQRPDIIFGSKRHPRSEVDYPALRRIYSWGYQQLNRSLFHLPIRDTQTGVKVFRRDVLAAVLPRMVEKRFAFDLELFVVARQQGFRHFVEMPVSIDHRFRSAISVHSVRNILIDTLAIYYRLRVLRFYERDIRAKPEESLLAGPSIATYGSDADGSTEHVPLARERRLRILIFNWRDITHPVAGGAEVYTHNVANEWIKEGHSVTLFCAEVERQPADEVINGLHIIRRGTRHSVYREAKRFYLLEGKGNFDLVIDEVNTRPFGAPKWVTDVPIVALIHQVCREIWFYETTFPVALVGRYLLEPLWLRRYRNVFTVTLSESSKDSLELYGLSRVVVVPVGFRSAGPPPDVTRETRPTLVFVGRLSANKRPNDAIEAFDLLRETMPAAVLWVVGTGPMEDRLRMSAPDGVHFLGKISPTEKLERLARANVLIATSVREGWGLVVTEAAAVGTPVVAYDVAGLRDSVRASNGVLSAANPKSLSSALRGFFGNQNRDGLSTIVPGGVITWSEVAARILAMATEQFPELGPNPDSVGVEAFPQPGDST
jgi:glycosyltransferase involved in cell wall biosynthesis/O-antigen/teichoic acid export membrane protein